ncbi:class I SAM-dependent RNA methyltransferase [Roseicella sp. DB1501]|uniref:class I SAM-dependent RNA methyltransferase n=1 Tax=Roseicella sp. DB1501 TaxID=2730925 RepID=UPI001490BD08|nr:class I SAM-dependent RNA methyltransferase [Roseicella sp. DB1501]NOG73842.1 class I SAM-dependent RNA methyltransferase [Roseicella sp. DB1501]
MTIEVGRFAVEALGAAGDGIARQAGRSIFLPGALPGELVEARLTTRRGEAWAGAVEAILEPSPARVAPPCPHFGHCGGCALQHLADADYAAWKREKLVAALARAGYPGAPVAALARTPPGTRRRADLALRRGAAGVALGFHAAGSRQVVDLAVCEVLDPRLVALLAPLREMAHRLPALRREGSAVLNLLDTGPDLLLRTDGPLEAPGRALLASFAAAHGLPRIAWAQGNGPAETAAQLGPVGIRFGAAVVAPPPGAFLQASPGGEAAIVAAVLAGLPERLPARALVADLFAGNGTLTFPLAARVRVTAFEGAPDSVAALAAAAGKAGARVTAVRRDLDRQPLLAKELQGFAAVVLDPPYAGAAAQIPLLARAGVPRIVYVSCNPAVLARDLQPLAGAGYRLLAATPVDQFLWSPHLESVVVLGR